MIKFHFNVHIKFLCHSMSYIRTYKKKIFTLISLKMILFLLKSKGLNCLFLIFCINGDFFSISSHIQIIINQNFQRAYHFKKNIKYIKNFSQSKIFYQFALSSPRRQKILLHSLEKISSL